MRSTHSLRPAQLIRRRTLASAGVVVGAALAAVAMTGLSAASAAAYDPSPTPATVATMTLTAPPSPAETVQAETLREIVAEAKASLAAAQESLTAAETVTADIAASGLDIGVEKTSIDTAELRAQVDRLSALDVLPLFFLPGVKDEAAAEMQRVDAQTASLREHLEVAQAKKAAEEAAARAKREAEAAAAAAAEAAAMANTPEGAKAAARQITSAEYGWGSDQFSCLESLWNRESGWNYQAYNASSGATGIPQALPGSKMSSAGADWQTNATTQIRWGLQYIAAVYGSPCGAWGHSQSSGWY